MYGCAFLASVFFMRFFQANHVDDFLDGGVDDESGGGCEWLQGAGQFNFLRAMTDEDWAAMKPKKS